VHVGGLNLKKKDMMKIPSNIELVYHGTYVEYVKDGDPDKPLTPKEKQTCDEFVEYIRNKCRLLWEQQQ
jgi:hypothetical protein